MMTTSSIDAYHEIVAKGLLSNKQLLVYDYIRVHGPVTINTMLSNLAKLGDNTGSLTGRISELRNAGLIESDGTEISPKGFLVTRWRVILSALPKKPEKRETVRAKIARLEARVLELECQVRSPNQ